MLEHTCVAECARNGGYICHWEHPFLRMYLWWGLYALYLLACLVDLPWVTGERAVHHTSNWHMIDSMTQERNWPVRFAGERRTRRSVGEWCGPQSSACPESAPRSSGPRWFRYRPENTAHNDRSFGPQWILLLFPYRPENTAHNDRSLVHNGSLYYSHTVLRTTRQPTTIGHLFNNGSLYYSHTALSITRQPTPMGHLFHNGSLYYSEYNTTMIATVIDILSQVNFKIIWTTYC